MKKTLFFILFSLAIRTNGQTAGSGLTDIDGNQYSTVIIGTQEWTTTNLRTSKFNNGQTIQFQATNSVNNTPNLPQYFYINNPDYGFLYNGFAVDNDNLVPSPQNGWRIPTQADWDLLFATTGDITGVNLTNTTGLTSWNFCTPASTNPYNFNILPNGKIAWENTVNQINRAYNYNRGAHFWKKGTVTGNPQYAYSLAIICPLTAIQYTTNSKYDGMSVRLVRNTNLSINNFDKSKVSIYPNPSKNIINIITDEVVDKIEIFDLLGKCVHRENNKKQDINIEHLSNGIYQIKIYCGTQTFNNKIIKN